MTRNAVVRMMWQPALSHWQQRTPSCSRDYAAADRTIGVLRRDDIFSEKGAAPVRRRFVSTSRQRSRSRHVGKTSCAQNILESKEVVRCFWKCVLMIARVQIFSEHTYVPVNSGYRYGYRYEMRAWVSDLAIIGPSSEYKGA